MLNDVPALLMAFLVNHTLQKSMQKFGKYKWLVKYHWIHYFMMPRPLVNTLEYVLYTLALNTEYFYFFVVLSCVVRPTMGIFYIPIAIQSVFNNPESLYKWVKYSICGLAISIGIDSIYYGKLTSSISNFLIFNVVQGHSEYYGVHSPFWYFTSAIPTLLGPSLPYFMLGLPHISKSHLFIILIPLLFFSLLKHKEFRFIYPIMDHLLFVAKQGAMSFHNSYLKRFVILTNFTLICLFAFIHQRGVYTTMNYLRTVDIDSVVILAPCYSFPGISYLHKDIPLKTLSCLPPHYLNGKLPEQDIFYENPKQETIKLIQQYRPSHIIKFQVLNVDLIGYHLNQSFFNSFFHDDMRRQGNIEIYTK